MPSIRKLETLQSIDMGLQTAISDLQMFAEKFHMERLEMGLTAINLTLGAVNVATSFEEAKVYKKEGDVGASRQIEEYAVADIFGNMTAFEKEAFASFGIVGRTVGEKIGSLVSEESQKVLGRIFELGGNALGKTFEISRKVGIVSEYMLGGQATVIGISDLKQGNTASGITVLASNVVDIAFAGRDAFSQEDEVPEIRDTTLSEKPNETSERYDDSALHKGDNVDVALRRENIDLEKKTFSPSIGIELTKIGVLGTVGGLIGAQQLGWFNQVNLQKKT